MSDSKDSETAMGIQAAAKIGSRDWTVTAVLPTGPGPWSFEVAPELGRDETNGLNIWDAAQDLLAKFSDQSIDRDMPSLFADAGLPPLTLKCVRGRSLKDPGTIVLQTELDLQTGLVSTLQLMFTVARVVKSKSADGPAATDAGAKPEFSVIAGVTTKGAISLGNANDADPVKRLLGQVSIDRLGVFYAGDDASEVPLFEDEATRRFQKGLSISAQFGLGGRVVDVSLSQSGLTYEVADASPGAADNRPSPAAKPKEIGSTTPPDNPPPDKDKDKLDQGLRYWLDLDKTLGPLQLQRIGGEWKDSKLGILLDAAIELAGLKVALSGLAIRFKPADLSSLTFEKLEFGLDGLALNLKFPPVAITGALLRTETKVVIDKIEKTLISYSGMASITAGRFTISAIGSYAMIDGKASFFIYGAFVGVLGGPPCFVVEGIAAGFGYNRAIKVPAIEDVVEFPLVRMVRHPEETAQIVRTLPESFPPTIGQYFVAAGVKFNSFKLISTFAVITVQFGTRFELTLLGVATLRQPPEETKSPAFIVIEMAIKVSFVPEDGLLSVEARLTGNSFLFDPGCKLTGGFAFYVWFPPFGGPGTAKVEDHSGDFVVTLGGYHPRFVIPAHYPRVPRVGFHWSPFAGLTIQGEAYFALTPSFVMAGGRLSAVYQSVNGQFRAWFEAYAHFLVGWAPFYYSAKISVRVGASYTFWLFDCACTIGFEIGARLMIEGPEFHGTAYVNLGIVAFTIPLGNQNQPKPPPLKWDAFVTNFLPHDAGIAKPLRVAITAGTMEEVKKPDNTSILFVNAAELRLSIESLIPITEQPDLPDGYDASGKPWTGVAFWEDPDKPPPSDRSDYARHLGIRPMIAADTTNEAADSIKARKLRSTLSLRISGKYCVAGKLNYTSTPKALPKALWSQTPFSPALGDSNQDEDRVIRNCLVGVEVWLTPPDDATRIRVDQPVPREDGTDIEAPGDQGVVQGDARPRDSAAVMRDAKQYRRNTIASRSHSVAALRKLIPPFQDSGAVFAYLPDPPDPGAAQADDALAFVDIPWFVATGDLLPQRAR